jgi:ATP-dependent exoDNAse (exonuclease V) alpha subunit
MELIKSNDFLDAVDAMQNGDCVFLTGKAGSGKTTLIKHILETWQGKRQIAVTATTGIAALGLGGATLHSTLSLPIGILDPLAVDTSKMSTKAKDVIKAMDCLVIDEAGMLLSFALDYIDKLLQKIRGNDKAFGGVQIVLVGDLYQLPPVVKDNEKEIIALMGYQSEWFFDSKIWRSGIFKTIILNDVYRQTDQAFVDILNRIRVGIVNDDDLDMLNSRVGAQNGGVIIAPTNKEVTAINNAHLAKLSGAQFTYTAMTSGVFNASQCLAEDELVLKVGAKVMFIANNYQADFRNGDMGIVTQLTSNAIIAKLDSGREVIVERYTWENVGYSYDKSQRKLKRETIGEFEQFPLKPAWAVTAHKSQGLTLSQITLDASRFFACGQCYVVLSRVTTMAGLSLVKPIRPSFIKVDPRVSEFFGASKAKQYAPKMLPVSLIAQTVKNAVRMF